jgi:hypothetical protein
MLNLVWKDGVSLSAADWWLDVQLICQRLHQTYLVLASLICDSRRHEYGYLPY